jgi:YidC/Oxa1 family membrane protein insertase
MDNKRVLIAFVLSFAVLIAFRFIFPPAIEQPAVPPPATSTAPPAAAAPTAEKSQSVSSKAPVAEASVAQDVHAERAEGTVVETSLYNATVYNEGGVLRSFQLKTRKFDDSGHPLELINGVSAASVGWPLAIVTGDPKLDALLAHALYVVKQDGNKVSLEFAGEGIHARREMEFDPENYQFTLKTTLEQNGLPLPHQILWQAGFGDQSVPDEPKTKNAVYDADSKFTRIVLTGIKEPKDVTASLI